MAGPEFEFDFDTEEFERFINRYPNASRKLAVDFLRQGGQLIRSGIVKEAKERFGTETAQSRMKTTNPKRPKGQYAGSVRSVIRGAGLASETQVAPYKPYDDWIEHGSRGKHIPRRLKRAQFRGHAPVRRGAERAMPEVDRLFFRLSEGAIEHMTGGI